MLLQTGTSGIRNQFKNIYDVAGNVSEWTMEAYAPYYRVSRAGAFWNVGDGYSVRFYGNGNTPGRVENYIGFRPTLYL